MHTPVHASWLNQVEIYFSVLQRKVLTPNDFASLSDLEDRILAFQDHYQKIANPFQWKFTRADLRCLLERLGRPSSPFSFWKCTVQRVQGPPPGIPDRDAGGSNLLHNAPNRLPGWLVPKQPSRCPVAHHRTSGSRED